MSADHRSSVRQNSNKVPSKRTRHDRYVDEGLGSEMPEVERRQVERVDNEHKLADPEMGVYPQKDKCGCKEIVCDEVRADIRGDLD